MPAIQVGPQTIPVFGVTISEAGSLQSAIRYAKRHHYRYVYAFPGWDGDYYIATNHRVGGVLFFDEATGYEADELLAPVAAGEGAL